MTGYLLSTDGNNIVFADQVMINEEKIYQLNNINTIFINVSSSDVDIIPVDDNEIKINLTGKVKVSSEKAIPRLETKINGKNLIIEVKRNSSWIGFFSYSGHINLEVYIPKEYKNNLNIDVSSADVTINDLEINNLIFDSSSGDLDLKSLKSNESTIKVSSGKVEAIDFNGDLEVVSSSGKIYVEYEEFNNNIFIKSSSGDVKLKLPQSSEFYLKADTSSGDIDTAFPISILGTIKDDYLEGTCGNSNNRIEIKASSGDIELIY